jgi:LysM repeat protein
MKKFLVALSFLSAGLMAKSQNLVVEGTAPDLYITHTVAPKENFYSVGRLYNQNAKLIASFNNLAMEKGLTIGQRVKIPLNEQNLDVNGNSNSGERVPLTHIVGKSETLSRIGSDHNASPQAIKQWNKLSSDNITPGTPLVVGHLKMTSTAGVAKSAATPGSTQQAGSQSTTPEPAPVAAQKKPEATPQAAAEKKDATPPVREEATKPAESVTSAPAKEAAAKETPGTKEVEGGSLQGGAVKAETAAKPADYSYSNTGSMSSVEGVFANVFTTAASQSSLNSKSGEAATFKSTSGWQDKKYYVLMNDVNPGTIVKIASTENKVIYAKVLGSMPDMKENNGLLLRISNAAASYLGIIDPRFPVQISYYQ